MMSLVRLSFSIKNRSSALTFSVILAVLVQILQSSGNLVGGGNRSTTPGYSRSSSGQHGDYPPSGEGGSVVSAQGPSTHTFGSGIVPLSQSGMPSTPRKTELPSMDEMVHSTISPILETFHGSRTSLQRPTLRYVSGLTTVKQY